MLDYNIINYKANTTIVKDGVATECIDLLSETYKKDQYMRGKYVQVPEAYEARPDLLSLAFYGTDKYGDFICKINGISNPFELGVGTILFIPSGDMATEYTKGKCRNHASLVNEKAEAGVAGSYSSKSKTSTIEKNINNMQKLKNEKRLTSEQTVGDQNFYIDRTMGIIIY